MKKTRGAVREPIPERYDLVCPMASMVMSRISAEGAKKYGEQNWTKRPGLPQHVYMNHAIRHLNMYLSGNESEPHIEKVLWNLTAFIHQKYNCQCGQVWRNDNLEETKEEL